MSLWSLYPLFFHGVRNDHMAHKARDGTSRKSQTFTLAAFGPLIIQES